MSGRPVRSPERAEDGHDKDKTEVDTRPESGVFLSPQSSIDQGTQDVLNIPRTDASSSSDNGYHTSTSSVVADPEQCHATFYVSHPSETQHLQQADYDDDILLDGEPDADPDDSNLSDDEHFAGGTNPPIDCRQSTEVSRPLEIPGASSFHSAHDRAIYLMDGTPPRLYNTHPLESGDLPDPDTEGLIRSKLGYRFTTGCLTNMPDMVQALTMRSRTPSGSLLNTSLRVTSGRLQASNRRADLQRQRTNSERVDNDDLTMPRDRSMSAPDIGIQRKLIQRQCAQELRKISDEFFEEFHQKGRRSRAGQSQCTQHSSSYPGTSSIKHGLWQSIVQSFSPGRIPSSSSQPSVASSLSSSSSTTTAATSSSGRPLSGMAGDNIRPRIVITKQNSDVD